MSAETAGNVDVRPAGLVPTMARQQTGWWLVALLSGLVALLKGVRAPMRWAATQALIDYRFGVVKRGFFGTFVADPLHLEHYRRFAWFSFAMLGLFFLLLLLFALRSQVLLRIETGEIIILFASSIAVTLLGQLNGYFELPLGVLTLGLLLLEHAALRFWIALPVVVIGVAVHENFVLVFLPTILVSFLLQDMRGSGRRTAAVRACILAAAAVATAAWLALRPSLTLLQQQQLRQQVLREADYLPALIVFDVFVRSLRDNLHIMGQMVRQWFWWKYQLVSVLEMVPTILLQLWVLMLLLRHAAAPRWIRAAAFIAAISPLFLHFLGWDVNRWNALAILSSFLVVLTACAYLPANMPRLRLSLNLRLSLFAVCLLNMSAGELLMGDAPVRQFPFLYGEHSLRMLLPRHWDPAEPTVDHP